MACRGTARPSSSVGRVYLSSAKPACVQLLSGGVADGGGVGVEDAGSFHLVVSAAQWCEVRP